MLQYIFIIPLNLLRFIWYILVATIRKFIPYSLRLKKSVEGKIVLITGGGSGIGRQTALEFAQRGAELVLWDIDNTGNAETARLVRECGAKAYTYTCDVTKREDVYRVAKRVKQEVGIVYMLINNAGIVSGKYFKDLRDEQIVRTLEVNTMAHFWTLKAFLPDMISSNEGHVVTISSILGEMALGGLSDYCASKYAVRGLHECIVRELAIIDSDVKCTVVCPYGVTSGMFAGTRPRFFWLVPFISVQYVAGQIIQAVLTDTDAIVLPPHMNILVWLTRILPTRATLILEDIVKSNEAMKTFTGRQKTE